MSIELKLLPVSQCSGFSFSQEVIILEQDRELFEIIEELQDRLGKDVNDEFNTYLCVDDEFEERHYGNTQEDSFGDPLKTLKIGQLISSRKLNEKLKESSRKNLAVWRYLELLDHDTRIALYWS